LQLTADDVAIITFIREHRFLTSRHLQRLLPHRSGKRLLERLAALYHQGYLDRPRAQLTYYATAGSAPLVYALGNRGAQLLANTQAHAAAKVDWTWKNRSVGREFIAHTLMTSDVRVGLTCALGQRVMIRTLAIPASHPLKVQIPGLADDLTVIPDYAFTLSMTAHDRDKHFFLESDRATMPVVRRDLRQTSMQRKFLAYLAGGGRGNAFGRALGIDNFRVLVLTTSRERIDTMLQALRDLTNGAGSRQFLFIEHSVICAASDLFTVTWLSGKGEPTRLAD
jgi:hypothetical protein